jgi:hypothetical protein
MSPAFISRDEARSQPESMESSMAKRTTDQVKHKVVAVAEQVGRIIGTVQAKVEGLNRGKRSPKKPAAPTKAMARAAAVPSRPNVDAPGKRHRKPVPSDPGVKHSDERIAKLKSANESRHGRHRRGRRG